MRSIAAALAAAATVLAVVGCGGESDDPTVTPAAGQWAMDYCTSIASLQTPLEDAAEALQQAGTIETPDEAQSAFAPMGAAATTFAEDMGSLRPTDTPGAAEVQRETDSLAATVDRYLKQARASLDAWNAGTGSRSQTLSLVGSQLRRRSATSTPT
jgi:hypothetical protein